MRKNLRLVIMLCLSVLITSGCGCDKKADKKLLCNHKNEISGDITEVTLHFKKDELFKEEYNITYVFDSNQEAEQYYKNRKLDMAGIKSLELKENKVLMVTERNIDESHTSTRDFESIQRNLKSHGYTCK